jgi:NADH:ubiquinone oxidoreductase subunit F (NADH-binding)
VTSIPAASAAGPGGSSPWGPVRLLGPGSKERTRLARHLERFGTLQAKGGGGYGVRTRSFELIEAVERSGLRGRGGAGFPTGRKLRAVAEAGGSPFVVANGTEGEPLSEKDAVLLASSPHLVLDGAAAAAAAVGAPNVLVCVGRASSRAGSVVAEAIQERAAAGIDGVRFHLFAAPDRYVAGEETALVHWLNGGPAKPTFTPPRPFERGVRGQPTLVQNVETLAHVALIARFGPDWYRTAGTPADPGMALVTVIGAVASPGVVELELGTSLAAAVAAAGRATEPLQAFLVGGFFGGWVPAARADRIALTHDVPAGLPGLGCGVIVALPEGGCGLVETARVVRYLANENAGQCGPCAFGLPAMAGAMEDLAGRRDRHDTHRLLRWSGQVARRGACGHPDAAARLVRSALRVFEAEVRNHVRGACRGDGRQAVPLPPPEPATEWR